MPIVRIELTEGRTAQQKGALIRRVTEAVVETLAVEPEQVRVLLFEVPPEHWAIGGTTLAQRRGLQPRKDAEHDAS